MIDARLLHYIDILPLSMSLKNWYTFFMKQSNENTILNLHTAVVLRLASAHKGAVILLDEQLGKIEGMYFQNRIHSQQLFHGARISCSLKKRGLKYVLSDVDLIDAPFYWSGEHLLFFHHVLELCNLFLSLDEQVKPIFSLISILYSDPESVGSKQAQKVFLCHFFKLIGMYSDQEYDNASTWLRACINEHPHRSTLHTAHFLNTLDTHEDVV